MPAPPGFDPMLALRLLGYQLDDPAAAIRAFRLHYRPQNSAGIDTTTLDDEDASILHALVADSRE
jgi:N-acetylmuramoyl-L-alanine amidase